MKFVMVFLLALAAQLTVCAAVYYAFEDCRYLFTDEDQLIENVTAFTFLFGALLAFWSYTRQVGDRRISLLVATVGLVGFLDELSFGERLFGLSMPSLLGVKIDGVHDLLSVPLSLLRRLLLSSPTLSMVILLGIAVALVVMILGNRKKLLRSVHFVMQHPPYMALTIFATLILVAILLDEHVIRFRGLVYVEELLELNAALSLTLVLLCAQSRSAAACITRALSYNRP